MNRSISKLHDHIIVCGVGATGRYVAHEFHEIGEKFVVIDRSQEVLDQLPEDWRSGVLSMVGDATSDSVLKAAGIDTARGLIAALGQDQANLFVTISGRSLNPKLRIVSRALEPTTEEKLLRAGADKVVQVNTIGGLRLASEMIRPEVTGFLDHMMRDPERTLRIEEIAVEDDSSLAGMLLAESDIRKAGDVLVIAVRSPDGCYQYNPGPDHPILAGETLIVIGDPTQVRSLRAAT